LRTQSSGLTTRLHRVISLDRERGRWGDLFAIFPSTPKPINGYPETWLSGRDHLRGGITGRGAPMTAIMKARTPPAKTEATDNSNGNSVDIGIVIPKFTFSSYNADVAPVLVPVPPCQRQSLGGLRRTSKRCDT
jgi:hypothetical protein